MSGFTDEALALGAQSVWDLGQGAGLTYADLGPGGKDLTLSGSGYTQGVATGLAGQPDALDFNGTAAILRRVTALDQVVTDKFTVVGVFSDNATPAAFGNPWICASFSGGHTDPFYTFGIFNNGSNQFRLVVDTGIGFSPVDTGVAVIGNGSYHMLALRYDGADIFLNIDGVDVFSVARTGNVGDMGSFALGDIPSLGAGQTINAILPAGAYWNDDALSESDLATLFAALTASPCNPPVNTVAPAVTGTTEVGETLTCADGTYTGDPTIVLTKQWYRVCGSDPEELIVGATSSTYVLTDDDFTCNVFCRETATNGCAPDAVTDSNTVGPITCGVPVNLSSPTITGVTAVGHLLTGSEGTWGCATTFDFQWYLDCGGGPVAVVGETTDQFTTDETMIGCTILFGVIAHGPGGDSAEVFSDPFGPIVANVPAAVRFYQSPPWRFVILDLPTFETLSFLDHIATDRSATFILDQPAVAAMKVPSDEPEVNIPWPVEDDEPFLAEGTRALLGFRREGTLGAPWRIRYAGRIEQLEDVAEADNAFTHITAYDPLRYLFSRPVRNGADFDYTLPGINGSSYTATRIDVIIGEIIHNTIVADGPVGIDAGPLYGGTAFWGGTIEALDQIDINFSQGTTVGEAIQQLTQTDQADILLTPIYDPIHRPGYLVELSIFVQAGAVQDNAIFAWDKPSRSLNGISRLIDGTTRATSVKMFAGQGGTATGGQTIPVQTDAAAEAKYGSYWYQQFWPGQNVAGAVLLLAQTALSLRKNGKKTVAISPAPQRSPIPFEEYYLGDRVPVYASRRFREPIPEGGVEGIEYQRIYGMPILIADDETETILEMLTTVQG